MTFEAGEIQLLTSAVKLALEQLRAANERSGANDAEMIAAGRNYSLLLQKLESTPG